MSTFRSRFTVPAIGTGIAFGLMRWAKTDTIEGAMVALGLTVFECMVVLFLERYAERRATAKELFRASQAQRIALEKGLAGIGLQIVAESAIRDQLQNVLERRESEAFDVDRLNAAGEAVAEAAYRSAIVCNQRQLEGGSPGIPNLPDTLPSFGD